MPDPPDVPTRFSADRPPEGVVRRDEPVETWPTTDDGDVVAHPVDGGHRIRVRFAGAARRDSALRATSSWIGELGSVSSLDDDGEELSMVLAGGVGFVALACSVLERVATAVDPFGALGQAAVVVERGIPQQPAADAPAPVWRRWAATATGTAADDESVRESPSEATDEVAERVPATPENEEAVAERVPATPEDEDAVAERVTRRSVFETIGESAERKMVANNARSDELPAASAPGRFDVALVDTGPVPDRTAALLAHVLGVPDAEAQRWCGSLPARIAEGVSAREARRIAVAVGAASGCTLEVSPTP